MDQQNNSPLELGKQIAARGKELAAEGKELLARAREAMRRPSPISVPPQPPKSAEGEVTFDGLALSAFHHLRSGRRIPASLCLRQLRELYEATDPSVFRPDQRTWESFARARVLIGFERIEELIGQLIYDRGVSDPKHPWSLSMPLEPDQPKPMSALDRAIAASKDHPDWSNRKIAQEVGVTEITVRRARKHDAPDVAPDVAPDRIGRDGKRYISRGQDAEDAKLNPDSYRIAFLIRADQAGAMAFFEEPADEEIIESVNYVIDQWKGLRDRLVKREGGGHGQKAKN